MPIFMPRRMRKFGTPTGRHLMHSMNRVASACRLRTGLARHTIRVARFLGVRSWWLGVLRNFFGEIILEAVWTPDYGKDLTVLIKYQGDISLVIAENVIKEMEDEVSHG